jgi:uncharacterized Zn finger protein
MSVFDTTNPSDSWPAPMYPQAREVEHGVRLSKSIEEIAGHWWSHRWLKIIDEFGLGHRWERAKLYASKGQITSIVIENGLVKAFVQGSNQEPYRVTVSVKTIPKAIWIAILQDLNKTSGFAISIAAGTLLAEAEIEKIFAANGVLLFPDRQGELHTKCTCLDWSNPCKHIAAVYLLLAAEFDRDPLLLFKLRGLESAELFSLAKPAAGVVVDILSDVITPLPAPVSLPTKKDISQFWKMAVTTAEIFGEWVPQQTLASLPSSLGEFPFWQGKENLLDKIRCVYETAPEYATTILMQRGTTIS